MPSWLVVVVAVATPLLAFAGSFGAQLLSRRSDKELNQWRRREETMRMLRWAVQLAADEEDRRASMGVAALAALADAELLQDEDRPLVEAIASTVVGHAVQRYDEERVGIDGEHEEMFVVDSDPAERREE